MTIPFLDFLKKKTAKTPKAAPVAVAPPPPVEKPSSERLSKTVMPNATRTIGAQDPFQMASGTTPAGGQASASGGRPSISFNTSGSGGRDLPPAVALALEPRVERAVSLELSDIFGQLPEGMVRPLEGTDATRRVLLKASELERGMASGKPSVSIATIYQQVPEFFLRPIANGDTTQVQLPFQKVMEQFSRLQVRADQSREQAVPQVETPFLKVTLEDDARFGTTTATPVETGDLPPVRLELATAETLAAAEPDASDKFIVSAPPSMNFPAPADAHRNGNGNGNGHGSIEAPAIPVTPIPTPTPVPAPTPAAPARIPFKLSPKGADALAPERVPASSEPSVPTSAPARIPFKMKSSEATSAPAEPWLTKENFVDSDAPETEAPFSTASVGAVDGKEEVRIALPLKPILQSLPPLQLTGDISTVPDDARIELPFSLLEPQLASGRVLLQPEQFASSLPEEFRGLFDASPTGATVLLPLQDVLKNLPSTSLRMRDDQIEQEQGSNFETPFSAKAAEDAKRFKVAASPVPKPTVAAAPALAATPAEVEAVPAAKKQTPPASAKAAKNGAAEPAKNGTGEPASPPPASTRTALQAALETDDELDAKAVVKHLEKMAGVKGCAIVFGDGLSLAGTLPEAYGAEGLCAMAPGLLQRIGTHMTETKLGPLRSMTLSCANESVTFFTHDNLCLATLHAQNELGSDVRERLARAVHELSRKYSNPV